VEREAILVQRIVIVVPRGQTGCLPTPPFTPFPRPPKPNPNALFIGLFLSRLTTLSLHHRISNPKSQPSTPLPLLDQPPLAFESSNLEQESQVLLLSQSSWNSET